MKFSIFWSGKKCQQELCRQSIKFNFCFKIFLILALFLIMMSFITNLNCTVLASIFFSVSLDSRLVTTVQLEFVISPSLWKNEHSYQKFYKQKIKFHWLSTTLLLTLFTWPIHENFFAYYFFEVTCLNYTLKFLNKSAYKKLGEFYLYCIIM